MEDSKIIELLALETKKANSFRHKFFSGLITGAATALGATVIGGIVLWLLAQLLERINWIPVLKDIITDAIIQAI